MGMGRKEAAEGRDVVTEGQTVQNRCEQTTRGRDGR